MQFKGRIGQIINERLAEARKAGYVEYDLVEWKRRKEKEMCVRKSRKYIVRVTSHTTQIKAWWPTTSITAGIVMFV